MGRGKGRKRLLCRLLRVEEAGALERGRGVGLGSRDLYLGVGLGMWGRIVLGLVHLLVLLRWQRVHVVALNNKDRWALGLGLQLVLGYNGGGSSGHIPEYMGRRNLKDLL
jgi:hypothetical protein